MTISFDDLLRCLRSLGEAGRSEATEPVYIRLTEEKFKVRDTITFTSKEGVIFALDIDESNELCGIEILYYI